MATLNYTNRLANIQNRKFSSELNEAFVSKSFSQSDIPEDVKYLAEAMKPIPQRATDQTIEAAGRVQKHLSDGLKLNFNIVYRTQGSIMSNTHIKVSDFDLLTIINSYNYVESGIPILYPYQGIPSDDIAELRKKTLDIMKSTYDIVDDKNEKCISIFNKALRRKVDIVFAFWFNTNNYQNTGNEYYRGVKFKVVQDQADYPFAHIAQVNNKGDNTSDGSRKGIRLLKNLKEDSETELKKIKSFHMTCAVHPIQDQLLHFSSNSEIAIAQTVSRQLGNLITDSNYRKSIKSPNGFENPFLDDDLVPDMKSLKTDLDTLIEDAAKDLLKSDYLKKQLLTY